MKKPKGYSAKGPMKAKGPKPPAMPKGGKEMALAKSMGRRK